MLDIVHRPGLCCRYLYYPGYDRVPHTLYRTEQRALSSAADSVLAKRPLRSGNSGGFHVEPRLLRIARTRAKRVGITRYRATLG